MTAANYNEASQMIRQIAAEAGIDLVLWGTGNPVHKPCVIAILDASGINGYRVYVYPQGEDKPGTIKYIELAR